MLSTPIAGENCPLKLPMITIRAVSVVFFFFFKMYLFSTCGCAESALLLMGCGLSRVAVRGPLVSGASLVAEPRLQGPPASVAVAWGLCSAALRLSCPTACGIFPEQGSNPCLLHWQAGC